MEKKFRGEFIKYTCIFLYFFLCVFYFYQMFHGDLIYNYGFSYAITKGEIPYTDFNMIVPPFSALFYAIPLALFGIHLPVYLLFQVVLLTILFYFLFQLFEKKAYLLLIITAIVLPFPFPTILFPGYNFLLLFEFVLLLYLEKTETNDWIIGILLGICFLTKQTVGICLCLPSIYYLFHNRKKVWKRIGGFILPVFLFGIYLFWRGNFSEFIDQCFLGMFDFTNHNSSTWNFYFFIDIILFIMNVIVCVKNKKNLMNYYILAFISISIPLFDYYHVTMYLFAFILLFLPYYKPSNRVVLHTVMLCSLLPMIWFGFYYRFQLPNLIQKNHLEFFILSKKREKNLDLISNYMNQHSSERIILFIENAYTLKMINDLPIERYDLINYGNNGYHSSDKIIDLIKKEKSSYFIINVNEYNNQHPQQQLDKNVLNYVKDHFELIDHFGNYQVYYKE